MFCLNCGNQLDDGVAFCPKCGEKVANSAEVKEPQAQPQKTAGISNKKVLIAAASGVVLVIILVIAVIALAGKGKKAQSGGSEKAGSGIVKAEPVQLATPQLSWYVDGSHTFVTWDPIDGCSLYRVNINGDEYQVSTTYVDITDPEGTDLDVLVQAIAGSDQYKPSEAATIQVHVPEVNYDSTEFFYGTLLSLDQLETWVLWQGYDYEILDDPENGLVKLDVSIKDDANSGGWRLARAFWKSYDAYSESMDEQLENIDGEEVVGNVIGNALESKSLGQGINNTFDEMEEDMDAYASEQGFLGALGAFFEDTDIHYIYSYYQDKTDHAPKELLLIQEKTRHEDLPDLFTEENYWKVIDPGKKALTFYSSYNRYLNVLISETDGRYQKWIIDFRLQ